MKRIVVLLTVVALMMAMSVVPALLLALIHQRPRRGVLGSCTSPCHDGIMLTVERVRTRLSSGAGGRRRSSHAPLHDAGRLHL
jgi:hypothetical protein